MKKGSEHMMFAHSPDGVPLSIVYDDLLYYYVTNLQGDVVAILDATGAEVVTYTYDAWGNIRTIGGSKATTLGQDNPPCAIGAMSTTRKPDCTTSRADTMTLKSAGLLMRIHN